MHKLFIYQHKSGIFMVGYRHGRLNKVSVSLAADKIDFDGVKSDIEFLENEMDFKKFTRI